jgi:hypothetical protein
MLHLRRSCGYQLDVYVCGGDALEEVKVYLLLQARAGIRHMALDVRPVCLLLGGRADCLIHCSSEFTLIAAEAAAGCSGGESVPAAAAWCWR